MSAVIESHGHDDHHHGPAKGLTRWLYTTNHKDIGTLYLWFSFAMFLIGGAMAMVIRAELFQPGMQIVEPEFYNQMLTLHGLVMVFGAVMPAFVGLANWLVPMMVGAPDMALPRMNNLSFWILPFAFFVLLSSLFMEGGAPNFGWTFYAPLSTTYAPPSVTFFIFSIYSKQKIIVDKKNFIESFFSGVLFHGFYLGGVFYSIDLLSEFWRNLSMINPVLYMVNAFRYGIAGITDINIVWAFSMVGLFSVLLFFLALRLLETGSRLRS